MNYEEFKKYVDEMNKNIFNKLKDNEEELAFYTELVKRFNDICKENEELKKHLKVSKACNLKTLEDYKSYYEDTTREQILEDTYIDYCAYVNLAHRYSKLKKQLEDITLCRDIASGHRKEVQDRETILLSQQQEFIKYLEDEIEKQKSEIFEKALISEDIDIYIMRVKLSKLEEILTKYKEIIGEGTNESR